MVWIRIAYYVTLPCINYTLSHSGGRQTAALRAGRSAPTTQEGHLILRVGHVRCTDDNSSYVCLHITAQPNTKRTNRQSSTQDGALSQRERALSQPRARTAAERRRLHHEDRVNGTGARRAAGTTAQTAKSYQPGGCRGRRGTAPTAAAPVTVYATSREVSISQFIY